MSYPGRLVLIGDPVSHSLSPAMQNAALRSAGIPLTYEAVQVGAAGLQKLLDELRRIDGAGNVTIPHKRAVLRAADKVSASAERAQACNTFRFVKGELSVDNTDAAAFDRVARELLDHQISDARVILLGAGGAAGAVLLAIAKWPNARVSIMNRTERAANELAQRFSDFARVEADTKGVLADATLVVNATPVGQHDDLLPYDLSKVAADAAIFDLVYRRGETPWVNAARRRGHRAVDGMPMLLEQGALAFQRWFGVEPDREAMTRALQ